LLRFVKAEAACGTSSIACRRRWSGRCC
jgi:hypothetical protein